MLCLVAVTLLATLPTLAQDEAKPVSLEKRAEELKNLRWGMFICWSFSTFSGQEWTGWVSKRTDYDKLFPAKTVDTDQWARTAKEAEMGYILFLTKHHDGFCLWDTKTTERKVTNAPLGKDVLRALKRSCDKYGVKLALYYSEGDWTFPGAEDGKGGKGGSNPEVKKAQLKELLTQYGPIEYLWLDCAAGDGGLCSKETTEWCQRWQPGCFVGYNCNDPSGNIRIGEMGGPALIKDPQWPQYNWLASEFTYPILPSHKGGAMWFYSLPEHDNLVHPVAKLWDDYRGAVKMGNIFSIDVGPDYEGKLRKIDVLTLQRTGQMIRKNR
jgi:alpha-L-fucosidase